MKNDSIIGNSGLGYLWDKIVNLVNNTINKALGGIEDQLKEI